MAQAADMVVLAGGKATRLRGLNMAFPKALLPVMGIPFMVWQALEAVRAASALGRILYVVREAEESLFRTVFPDLPIPAHAISEASPSGTGGAILKAWNMRDVLRLSDPFLVLNGDVLFPMRPDAVLDAAREAGTALQGIEVADAGAFGSLEVKGDRVTFFREKTAGSQSGLINAGLYALRHDVLKPFADKYGAAPCSFERDIAPALAHAGQCGVVLGRGPFMDIGTPQSYMGAEDFIRAYGYEISGSDSRSQAHN